MKPKYVIESSRPSEWPAWHAEHECHEISESQHAYRNMVRSHPATCWRIVIVMDDNSGTDEGW